VRVWSLLADYARRLTGARFIASLTAVLDFDAHQSPFLVCGDAGTTSPWAKRRVCTALPVTLLDSECFMNPGSGEHSIVVRLERCIGARRAASMPGRRTGSTEGTGTDKCV
jgi:hypothetical protein